jgi:hypothetical protein
MIAARVRDPINVWGAPPGRLRDQAPLQQVKSTIARHQHRATT